jgi:hypothetical protein
MGSAAFVIRRPKQKRSDCIRIALTEIGKNDDRFEFAPEFLYTPLLLSRSLSCSRNTLQPSKMLET